MNYANDNLGWGWVENDGVLVGFTIFDAADVLAEAVYSDDYNALYNDGWVIKVDNKDYDFTSENGDYYMTFDKAKVDLIVNNR